MQFIFQEDSNLYGYGADPFVVPDQVRQIGDIDGELRIYMEDYVYTYLKQYARGDRERLAVLVGRELVMDEERALVISGAIQGKFTQSLHGLESFTQESWDYIQGQMEQFFSGLQIVGWMHSQPGFGTFLAARDEAYHRSKFSNSNQVLFLVDPVEKQDAFYVLNGEGTALREAKGYFIYYEKNQEMQEYMVEEKEEPQLPPPMEERPDAAAKIRTIIRKKQETANQLETRYTLLAGLSGILCLACLGMAFNMYSSQGKLKELETQVALAQTIAQEALEGTEAVFAAQNGGRQAEGTDAPEKPENPAPAPQETQPAPQETQPEPSQPAAPSASAEPEDTEAVLPVYYTVEEGDTLIQISNKFYSTTDMVEQIMEVNNLDDPNKIYYGKELLMPQP